MSAGSSNSDPISKRYFTVLCLGALGVVYGDIGTSPLYAMRECFFGPYGVAPTEENVLGVLSLILWSLILVVSIKYVTFVLRADNRGEGGALALSSLLLSNSQIHASPFLRRVVLLSGLFGAALIYGDGFITPAISVLSAVEGLRVATPIFEHWVVPATVVILLVLFFAQRNGTARLGMVFGPIIFIWFTTIGLLGAMAVFQEPRVLRALNPFLAVSYVATHGLTGMHLLGSLFLAVTGSEALYADMGHFGRKPIRTSWFVIALPALALNYVGQGALILSEPSITNPFYQLAPAWALYPLVALATTAAVIASQALISGAFSITAQAIQLGYLPRLQVLHTSSKEIGQIYIPVVNTILCVLTLALVLEFRNSSNLAAAYGIAVSLTMLLTTAMISLVALRLWNWPVWKVVLVFGIFLVVDLFFTVANGLKFFDGGWVPIVMGGVVFLLMHTWLKGREILADRLREVATPMDQFFAEMKMENTPRVPGTAVFMARDIRTVPVALLQNTLHNRVIHKTVVLLQVVTEDQPYVSNEGRIGHELIGDGFYRVYVRYGFMESPDVPAALKSCKLNGAEIDPDTVTYFLGREIILATQRPGMAIWRERLFGFLTQVALRATAFYRIPPEQVIEIGLQVEM